MQIFKATENGFNDKGMTGQKYYELVKKSIVTARLYPCVKSSQFVYYEDIAKKQHASGLRCQFA